MKRVLVLGSTGSTGRIFALLRAAKTCIRGPAITIVSLFASAKSIPFSNTILEGKSPAAPAIPFTTISGFASSINLLKSSSLLFLEVKRLGHLYFDDS